MIKDSSPKDPDTITLDMDVTESQEIPITSQESENTEDKERKVEMDSNTTNNYVVYEYLGQNIRPNKVIWVQYGGEYGPEGGGGGGGGFAYEPSRNSFIRLVFGIVLFMLICTAGFNVLVHLLPPLRSMFERFGFFFVIGAMIFMIGLSCSISFCRCARVPPGSYICLFLAVVGMSVITSWFTVKAKTILIVYALIGTTVTVLVCILIACSSFDFTRFWIYIIVAATVFAVLSMLLTIGMFIFDFYIKPLHIVILFVGTLFSVVILIAELQMIIGGKSMEIDEEDYALAAFMVYTSIVDIFIRLLMLSDLLS
ncbi:uncharacterized protein LOC135073982 [Ostrinia nubilalis]|uniref:uncharacterized protein LOC135073982 n=1 Tax=Ostrinia nubilalis TaxID=29057 RepID=UPI003082333D